MRKVSSLLKAEVVPKLAWCCAIEMPEVLSILGEACKYYD
jgi:hypothetical protein